MQLSPAQVSAKSHIEEIRRRKVQYADDGKGGVVADLQGALKILSEQLYNKSTHFLLELIQNADDNSYEAEPPSLTLTYNNSQLRVDCNEIGFMPENVDAICGIGSSSKARIDQGGRYIGHKGIGFKSVFKAADVVHICSRNYSFKFDKTNVPLGMITPIWEDFPDEILPGHTSFFLHLSNDSVHFKRDELIKDLHATDSRVLIFLNKLKELNLRILSDTEESWKMNLKRTNGIKDGLPMIILEENDKIIEYIVINHQVEITIEDDTGNRSSEIILAFPVNASDDETKASEAETQKVYTFLPVRDCGFKFLLQADFVLTANREDLDESHPRNKLLYKAIQGAFIKAIQSFSSSVLRYSWLRYLPRARPSGLLFYLGMEIQIKLRHLSILESCAGLIVQPNSLSYIPSKFLDSMGVPFTLCSHTREKYLSLNYQAQHAEALMEIGVKELSIDGFLEDLDWFIKNNQKVFQEKHAQWHSELAEALIPNLGKGKSRNVIEQLEIIPLRDGKWLCAKGNIIFFSENNSKISIPDGIQVLVVDPAAEADFNRRRLFSELGVKQLDTSSICPLIMDLHQDPTKVSLLSLNVLKSHAEFLYRSNYRPPQDAELWFTTQGGGKCQGSRLYADTDTESSSAATHFFDADKGFHFLHADYLLLFSDQREKWFHWLSEVFSISIIPRLVKFYRKDNFELSEDFHYLFRTQPSSRVLSLLKDNWKHYSTWIEIDHKISPSSSIEQSRTKVRTQLASTSVKCLNGRTHYLGKTSLPGLDTELGPGSHLAVLDINDPNDQCWQVFQCLGVAVKKNLYFYLLCLENMQSTEISINDVLQLYEEVQGNYIEDEQHLTQIRKFANDNPVVYLPPTNENESPRWIKHQDCVWSKCTGDASATNNALETFYPSCKELFCGVLGVYDNETELISAEVGQINISSNLADIAHLLIRINNAVVGRSMETVKLLQYLTNANIFPISIGARKDKFDLLASGDDRRDWFIADLPPLLESFREKIPLLALTNEVVSQLDTLFSAMKLDRRRLSEVASGKPRARGNFSKNKDYAEELRQKAQFIIRLVPRSNYPHDDKRRLSSLYLQLRSITVYEATSIRQNWSVVSDGHRIDGRESSVRVALDEKEGWLYLFMTREDVNSPFTPIELIDKICLFCGIKDATNSKILCSVMSRMSTKDLHDLFQRQRIPHAEWIRELQEKKGIPPRYNAELEPQTLSTEKITQEAQTQISQEKTAEQIFRADNSTGKKIFTQEKVAEKSQVESSMNERRVGKHENNIETSPQNHINLTNTATKREQIPWQKIVGVKMNDIRIGADSNMPAYRNSHLTAESSSSASSNKPAAPNKVTHISSNAASNQEIAIPRRFRFKTEFSKTSILRAVAADNTIVMGELTASVFFQRRIGRHYAPEKHWTSPIRSQVGYSKFTGDLTAYAAFTFTTCRTKVTDILIHNGHRIAENWRSTPPVYHVDVVTTAGSPTSFFPLSAGQLERARRYALQSASVPEHVLILIKISKVHSDVDFRFFVDPWQFYLADSIRLQPETLLKATIGDPDPQRSVSPHRRNASPHLRPVSVRSRSRLRDFFSFSVNYEAEDVEVEDAGMELNISKSVQRRDRKRLGPYIYKALRGATEIRLLNLLPGKAGSLLQGIIRHTSLETPEPYQALSYAWGDSSGDHVLQTPEGLIRLHTSLHSALQRLRDTDNERMLWIDAICIDQDDRRDKDKQIPLMAKIYHSATLVVAYLGIDADKSNLALQTLQQIKTKADNPKIWPSDLPPIPHSWKDDFIPPASDSSWKALGALFARPWFRRVWIIQEVVVAHAVKVVCGDWLIDWDELYAAVLTTRNEIVTGSEAHQALRGNFEAFMTLASARKRDDESFDWALYNLLEKFRYADATIPSDRMFALLNLAADGETQPQLFEQNYSLPFETVVLQYATAFVRQGRTLPMIYSAGLSSKRDNDIFPSWVPDWTAKTTGTLFDALERGVPDAPETNTPLHVSIREDAKDELILSKVLWLDIITYVSKAANTPEMLPQYLNEVANVIDNKILAYPTGERCSSLKWKVPIANAEVPMVAAFDPLELRASYLALMDLIDEGISPYGHEKMSPIDGEVENSRLQDAWIISQDYLSALQGTFSGSRFVVTGRGYVGIAPNLTKPGDVVSLLGGSKVAFLFRRSTTRQGAYRLVGGCYIHGIKIDNSAVKEESRVRIY